MNFRIWPKVGFMGKPKIIKISSAFLYLSLKLSPSDKKHPQILPESLKNHENNDFQDLAQSRLHGKT